MSKKYKRRYRSKNQKLKLWAIIATILFVGATTVAVTDHAYGWINQARDRIAELRNPTPPAEEAI